MDKKSSAAVDQTLNTVEKAVEQAHLLRKNLRGKTKPGDPERERQIGEALDHLLLTASPLRALRGKQRWNPFVMTEEQLARAKDLATRITKERLQLSRMRRT